MYKEHHNQKVMASRESSLSALIQHWSRPQNLCSAAKPSSQTLKPQILKHTVGGKVHCINHIMHTWPQALLPLPGGKDGQSPSIDVQTYGYTQCILINRWFFSMENSQIILKRLDDAKPKAPSQQLRDEVNGQVTGLGERKQIHTSAFQNWGYFKMSRNHFGLPCVLTAKYQIWERGKICRCLVGWFSCL